MTFLENLQSRMMPRNASAQGIFAPPGANGPIKFWDLMSTYDGPGAERLLTKLEQAGKVPAGTAEKAAAGAGHDALWAAPEGLGSMLSGGSAKGGVSGLAGGARGGVAGLAGGAEAPIATALGGAGMVPVNPIYQSPLYASLGFGNQVSVPMMADTAAGAAAGLVDNAAPTAEQALMQGFEQLSQLPNADRPGILSAAIDARAAAGKGVESFDVLTRALLDGPMEDSAPALRSAIDTYAARIIEGGGGIAPTASRVAEEMAPAVSKVAAELAPSTGRAFAALSPTMSAVLKAAGPIEARALRGISAFARPLESSSTACLTGIVELMTRVHL
ncbi:MAG: hypothetical protein H7287_08000 [Thermoleophilia bacterium]|nr:hypothetical protein [Thermoleophilia bacterium]